jgi:hypothetical protein
VIVTRNTCRNCGKPFADRHWTKRHFYCAPCRPFVEREQARERDERRRRKAGKPIGPRRPRKPDQSRLIRCAGFDPDERRISHDL